MMFEPHYDEEALIALLEAGDETLSRDSHIATCTACSKTLASVREIADCLKSPDVWDTTEISPDPNPNVLAFLDRAQAEMRAEDAAAEPWLRELLAQPREAWAPTLHAHPEWRTAGMVRGLIAATDRAIETMPPDAVEITALAVEIAEALPPARFGDSTVLRLRGHAWRERAYALYFTGSYNEAVAAVERSRKVFAECGYSEFDDARAGVVLALIGSCRETYGEALRTAHLATEVFGSYGACAKLVAARRTEAIILYMARRFRDALAIYHDLERERLSDEERAALWQNIALCYREIGEFGAAGRYFAQAIETCTTLGMLTSIAKTRWHFGRVLLAQGRNAESLVVLRQVRDEFTEANMANDVAEVTTDIAHALVLAGRMGEVPDECRRALEYFTTAGLATTEPAMSAISFLREAAAVGRIDEYVVSDVRLRVLNSRPQLNRIYAD
jgi:tetratricopeptide (TPR) repeat protein